MSQPEIANDWHYAEINKGEFIKDCYEILAIGFRDELYGDDKNEMILLEAIKIELF